ncbi:WecB/TagA/CpsF family glycosyltransferase [Aestuariivivens sediminicola]|uniref:WecB/TagA/CpsF family glycosyltransferase n=1 Tax=Aestuariivivens sediminicola TaxID=2913560 RepID=UPI001F55D52D|nr:WecB/TagA/CpsF family glycosyltransferase [Aestuariivivens sediminicola]
MVKSIHIKNFNIFSKGLNAIQIEEGSKSIINTINAHSYIVAKSDKIFRKALEGSDILLPDGEGIVFMSKWVYNSKIKKIAGADIHVHLLNLADAKGLRCFYLGASQSTLDIIKTKQQTTYPNIDFGFYSPPFKPVFNDFDNKVMLQRINAFQPDILFVGMTAPKQEKWVHQNKEFIDAKIICTIGAVFDFVAETKKRAPKWVIACKMEWLYRSFTAWRLTKRYMYSTPLFLLEMLTLKIKGH